MQKLADIKITVEQIEEVLPQTQCRLCQYAGCEPYAHAIVENHEQIDRCPPGGVRGLLKLAEITGQDASPYLSEMANKEKPLMRAVIREAECIGCTKCIQACPVDAILGSSKTMHTVIAEECTGCELCVAPCPVDCIDLLIIGKNDETPWPIARQKAEKARKRYQFRQNRLEREKLQNHKKHQLAKSAYKTAISKQESISAKKQIIAEAIARAKAKNNL